MKRFFLAAAVMGCLLCSCNPARRIHMENASSGEARFTWTIKKDSLKHSPFFISNNDVFQVKLHNRKPYNRAILSYGTGSWSVAALTALADDLEGLHLQWPQGSILLTSTADIVAFLKPRRSGLFNTRMRLVLQ